MKLYLKLEATQVDPDGVKREEFDEALEQAVEGKVTIERVKSKDVSPNELIGQTLRSLSLDLDGLKTSLDDPYPSNPSYTWRQMCDHWGKELCWTPT